MGATGTATCGTRQSALRLRFRGHQLPSSSNHTRERAGFDFYLDRKPADVSPALDLFPVESEKFVRLIKPTDAGVFQFAEEPRE